MPKIIIDGKEIEFTHGQTIIQAAKNAGIEIPHFCWHPSLSISGNCRVCLVEVEKMPKLVISCATIASEGMVVHTQSEKTLAARKAVMEFILINHPLDCPICDEAGECKLQDYSYQHSIGESRFTESKTNKDKRVELGPYVLFDGDRCISCSRCIRFCEEIAGETELTFAKRGDRVTIVTFPGKQLDNPYSICVTDICPVGALTNRDFRFKSRVWEMSANKTICTGCSRGCNIDLWVRSNQILRITPRTNEAVNSFWMCDYGRLNTFKFVNDETRVNGPHLRREGVLTKVGWDEAFAFALSDLKNYNKDEVAFIGSAFASCEDNFLLSKFTKSIFNSKHLDFAKHIENNFADSILKTNDKSPNSLGAEAVGIFPQKGGLDFSNIIKAIDEGRIKALYLMEDDLIALNSSYEKILSKLNLLIVNSTNFNSTTNLADIVFPASTYAEKFGTWINSQGIIQKIKAAVTTFESDRILDGMELSRLDKFGTDFDKWGNVKRIDARPSWKILVGLANAFGIKFKFNTAEDVFDELSKTNSIFENLDYEKIGEYGYQLKIEFHEKSVKA